MPIETIPCQQNTTVITYLNMFEPEYLVGKFKISQLFTRLYGPVRQPAFLAWAKVGTRLMGCRG